MALQERRVRRGRLTTRIVTQESMSNAVRGLLSDTQRYVIVANQKRFNWRSGKSQSPVVVINDGEPISLDRELDPRLRYSRRVIILVVQKDGGVGKVDLTFRTWESWSSMPSLTARMLSFDRSLLEGACTRLVGIPSALMTLIAPPLVLVAAFFSWALAAPARRHEVFVSDSSTQNIAMPSWLADLISITLHVWVIFAIIALMIYLIYGMSGSLRVWPDVFTGDTITKAVFNFRKNFFDSKNVSGMVAGVVVGVLVAWLSLLLF